MKVILTILKNIIKIIIAIAVIFGMLASVFPSEDVVRHVWPIMIPFYIIVAACCMTYKITPDVLIGKFLKL